MKKVLLSAAVLAFAFSFTSCKKCGSCSVAGVEGTEICKGDVGQIAYDLSKSSCESGGGTWED